MSSKVNNLSELEVLLTNEKRRNEGILHFLSTFNISRLLRPFNPLKRKGISVSSILNSLISIRLTGKNIHNEQNNILSFLRSIDDNTFYRLMNNQSMNWRRLLMSFSKQFQSKVKENTQQSDTISCFVIDDTDLEKKGKTIEFIGRIFNHVNKLHPLGFKMLLLAFWDGKSLTPLDFSLHREKGKKGNYGMSKKELKDRFSKKRDPKSPANTRVKELDTNKNINTVNMIKRAVKNGFKASYVLMDSWFVNDYMIKSIRSINNGAMHVLGMCKVDNRKYTHNNKELNAHQLITKYERKKIKYSRKYKSHYFTIVVDYKGQPVRLFFIKYKGSKRWSLLLTSNKSINFTKAIEIYQIRWSIEVLFKECKQYLQLGRSQNTDFDGQVADTSLALITYTVLSLKKRFESYETLGILFREVQIDLFELTLWERIIQQVMKIILNLLEIFDITPEETISKLITNNQVSNKLMAILTILDSNNDQFNQESVKISKAA
ncbi:MAG: transposase [Flavobacteriales bacterium]|nr:transposase [Flavobacteriales bacterium]